MPIRSPLTRHSPNVMLSTRITLNMCAWKARDYFNYVCPKYWKSLVPRVLECLSNSIPHIIWRNPRLEGSRKKTFSPETSDIECITVQRVDQVILARSRHSKRHFMEKTWRMFNEKDWHKPHFRVQGNIRSTFQKYVHFITLSATHSGINALSFPHPCAVAV